ncbi:MAG TPA: hypothetical protein VGV64_08360 [Thermoplasmata archaeon]|nr:hypothetical protein [Thermoplasmata archaeon]HEV2429834.1 hypothetical protein [Thermoplasmata archaeon]
MARPRSGRRRGPTRPRRTPPSHRPPTAPIDRSERIGSAYLPPEPTAHAICRRCGRIVRVPIEAAEAALLQSFVDRRPAGWVVEGLSFSFTGICVSCRES